MGTIPLYMMYKVSTQAGRMGCRNGGRAININIGVTAKPTPRDIIVRNCKPRKAEVEGMRQSL